MPGRVSIRSARNSAAAVSRKSSTQTLKSRGSASARSSALAVEIPDEGPLTSLRTQICTIFADAQRSTATQRKAAINLRKVQEACCYEPVKPRKQQRDEEFGEAEFNTEVGRCVLRVLGVKKSESVGDRVVRFLGLFLKLASDKDNVIAQSPDADATDAFSETPSSRLTSHVLSLLLPLLSARDKVVRFRSTQIVAHLINTLDSIDDELFQLVRSGLLRRLRDKESNIRVQAVLGLGRLADEMEDEDNEDSDDESAGGVLERLLDVLQNDQSAEVRRSLLLNLPFTPATLPYLLERARDLDAATRRALYSRLLPALGDFRHLSLTHREKLLRWGLRDRDENVRKATARLFRERWIEDCAGLRDAADEQNAGGVRQASEPSFDALLELLERIDVVNSGVEGGVALEAMRDFWDGRPDYREYITFDQAFWNELTPESAFVARTFNDYCRLAGDSKLQGMVEDKMPEVTMFAILLQNHLNVLKEGVQRVALQDDAEAEEDTVQQEFAVEQLLHIALTLDYSDEVGRRTMFSVMREALALAELPEECTKLVVEVLRTVCGSNAAGEREFCGIVLEAVAEVHDTIMGEEPSQPEEDMDESFHSARSELSSSSTPKQTKKPKKSGQDEEEDSAVGEEKVVREIMVNMKCLHIAQCMLQNVQCDLEQNSHLVTMLNNLVVPAVRSQEAPIRERGLLCLGLCCLLSKNLAEENLTLFLHCFAKGHEALQTIAIQTISDILVTHPTLLSPKSPTPIAKPLHKMYARALRSPDFPVQSTAALALSKLMLTNTLTEQTPAEGSGQGAAGTDDLLRLLTLAYFDPETRPNAALRQTLAYFLPVYCHTRPAHAARMARVAPGVLRALAERMEQLDEGEEMVGLGVVAGMLAEWTDPRRGVGAAEGRREGEEEEGDAHFVLAGLLLEKCAAPGVSREEKKAFVSMLGKLHLAAPEKPTAEFGARVREMVERVDDAVVAKAAVDAAGRNALAKLRVALEKMAAACGDADAGKSATPGVVESVEQEEPEEQEEDVTGIELTMPDNEGTVLGDEDEDANGDTVMGDARTGREQSSVAGDSLIESLLDDDDDGEIS